VKYWRETQQSLVPVVGLNDFVAIEFDDVQRFLWIR
jgi:hypothetical protein